MKVEIKRIINILKEHNLYISANVKIELLDLEDVIIDSREVKKNDVFIAIFGFTQDGHKYIPTALQNGAGLIIHSQKIEIQGNSILVKDSRKAGALIASELHGNPSSKLKLIGITGTNGKTTTSTIIFDILNKMNIKCGLIGTLGYSFGAEYFPLERTTPDITELNKILDKMVNSGCEAVVMEVSSHSLVLDRVYGQKFSAIGFTNLTQDHLDFHHTIENYYLAKRILFESTTQTEAFAVINCDDEYGQQYYSFYPHKKISYGLNETNDYYASDIVSTLNSTKFTFHNGNITDTITTNYVGDFNVYNLSLAMLICQNLFPGLIIKKEIFTNLKRTAGRLEPLKTKTESRVFLDYAHTPDAIEQVLKTLNKTKPKRLISVVGCGGERDVSKRPLMAHIATKLSDLVIFTDDNPRHENHNLIIADMVQNLNSANYFIIRDRKLAIQTALELSDAGDVVVLLGKGHENYQVINDEKIHLSDGEIACEYEKGLTGLNQDGLSIYYDVINIIDLSNKLSKTFDRELFATIPNFIIKDISTDSRTIKDNSLFIALKGDNFDGNDYIETVLDKYPHCFVVGEIEHSSNRYLKVSNSLQFYGYLAKHYLAIFDIKKIAITGSTGKTTTKEILANILEENHQVLKTMGNENNYIGLPRTIFRIRPEQQYAILEIGTNSVGEINFLSNIIVPDYAVITSVDSAHLEKLISLEGIYKEKTSLFKRKLKYFLFPGDNELFAEYKSPEFKALGYSVGTNEDNSFRFEINNQDDETMTIQINNSKYQINCQIPYFGLNYALAIALTKLLNISPSEQIYGLKKSLKMTNRMNIIKKGMLKIIADCYNANPKSTAEAIKFWLDYDKTKPHLAILGDMLELGETAQVHHLEIGKLLNSASNTTVYTVGELAKLYGGDRHFAKVSDLISSNLLAEFENGVILIKGSHGIHLEKILEIL